MIAAGIMRRNGHEVSIYDAALEGWENQVPVDEKTVLIGQPDSELEKVIADHSPDIIGISALFTNLMESAHRLARLAKKVRPQATVILGGNHVSNAIADYVVARQSPDTAGPPRIVDLEDENIDFAMRGEVDFEFPRLVDALVNGSDPSQIPGLVTRDGSDRGYVVNPPPARIADLDELPVPARDLVNMERYFEIGAFHSPFSTSRRVLSVMASRGCPEKCTFCTTPEMWGSIVRWRSTKSIVGEIREASERYRIGEIQFEDDTLTARKKNLLELCRELEKIGLPWCTPNGTKVNYHLATQPELYRAMADAGCYQITLACESGVQRVLDEIVRKRLRLEEIEPAIENAKRAGMLVHTFWILGFPGETYEEMQETVRFALDSGADSFSFAILSPLPGTPIHRQVVAEDLWWPGSSTADLMYRSSLIRVPGFDSPEEFERFVSETKIKANSLLKQKDPERFRRKHGEVADERSLFK